MKFNKLTLGLAAVALAATPALAQMAGAPAIAPVTGDESELEGGEAILVGILATAAVVAGIVVLASDDEVEPPISA